MQNPSEQHKISLQQAIDMTTLYRANRAENLPICETFSKASIESLISNPRCASFRIYYGMNPDKSVHAILVAADEKGHDILPLMKATGADDEGEILEDAERCPTNCPPASPLNG
jgi:hypothetical protein